MEDQISSFNHNMQISPFQFQYPVDGPSIETAHDPGFVEPSLLFPLVEPLLFPLVEPGFIQQLDNPQQLSQTSNENAQSMPPPPKRRKPKAPTMQKDDWKPYESRIVQLYAVENRTLPEVQDIIETEFKIKFT